METQTTHIPEPMSDVEFYLVFIGFAAAILINFSVQVGRINKLVKENKSMDSLSCVSIFMTFLNCLLFNWYGTYMMGILGFVGAVLEGVILFYLLFGTPKKERPKILGLLFLIISIFITTVILVSRLGFHCNTRKTFCGVVASVSFVILHACSLSIMWTVITTENVECMACCLSMSLSMNGLSWFNLGLIIHDYFVIVPNGIGFMLGVMLHPILKGLQP